MNDKVFIGEVLTVGPESGKKKFTVNSKSHVSPASLLKLPFFVPSSSRAKHAAGTFDATDELSGLSICSAEGYNEITISGPVLNMDLDFKIWVGIIRAFSIYGLSSNSVQLKFTEFAGYCGFPSKRFTMALRRQVNESLARIRAKGVSFVRKQDDEIRKAYMTGLLFSSYLDFNEDVIILRADEKLWELYQADIRIRLPLDPIYSLPRKEVAQAIYTLIHSLPTPPAPLSFARIRERLALASQVFEQNRAIKTGLSDLAKIGYLKYSLVERNGQTHVMIESRDPKLKHPAP